MEPGSPLPTSTDDILSGLVDQSRLVTFPGVSLLCKGNLAFVYPRSLTCNLKQQTRMLSSSQIMKTRNPTPADNAAFKLLLPFGGHSRYLSPFVANSFTPNGQFRADEARSLRHQVASYRTHHAQRRCGCPTSSSCPERASDITVPPSRPDDGAPIVFHKDVLMRFVRRFAHTNEYY